MQKIWKEVNILFHNFFDLESDRASYDEIIENIESGVEFKGTNLWILIFAIMVASVGLNVNSTAVVIGAMLISPLMGPIMGVGLGLGINDFELIKKALKNLGMAVLISVITSTLYFMVTPLSDAQSELLARTTPTLWDVLIAFFGGLAGIVASTRKEKSNAIPGVAIATALMPPLCTAGYGIATGNMNYFLGAAYLFFINSVFISISAFIIIRFLKVPFKTWMEEGKQRKMKNYVILLALITLIPSIYLAFGIVKRSIFNRNATLYITNEFNFEKTRVIEKDINPVDRKIEVILYGDPLDNKEINYLKKELLKYNLKETSLIIRQNEGAETISLDQMKSGIISDLYLKNEELIQQKDLQIEKLNERLSELNALDKTEKEVCQELEIQYPDIEQSAFNKMIIHAKSGKSDTLIMVYLNTKRKIPTKEVDKMSRWLKVRLKQEKIKIIQE